MEALLTAENRFAVTPDEKELRSGKGTGEDDPLIPQHGADQRDDQVGCVGINGGALLHRVQPQRLFQQVGEKNRAQLDRQCRAQRQQQPAPDLRGKFHLKGVEDHAGDDEVQRQLGEDLAVLRLQHLQADKQSAQKQYQKQGNDFFDQRSDQHQFISIFSLFFCADIITLTTGKVKILL